MKFTEFRADGTTDRWHDAVVRSIDGADVPSAAAIHAEREGVDLDVSENVVSRWTEADPDRFVLVAEHRGSVRGYGKAEWLVPGTRGGNAPTGWYLTGLVVAPSARRHGLGVSLTEERVAALAAARDVFYFANVRNSVTIALHERLGFVFETNHFTIPGVEFEGGRGALFRLGPGHGRCEPSRG